MRRRVSLLTDFVVGVFVGGAVSSIAQDPSDVAFFYAQGKGWLATAAAQVFFWYYLPFLLYGSFAVLAYLLGKFTNVSPIAALWIYLISVLGSSVLALTLPQANSMIYVATVALATVVSVFLVLGVLKEAKRFR